MFSSTDAAIQGGIKGRQVDRRAAITVAGDVRRVRTFLNWCYRNEYLKTSPRYGTAFSPISASQARRDRRISGPRDMSAADIRATLEKATRQLKPLVLLGINAGIGNKDLAAITLDQLPEMTGEVWIDLPRGKTGAHRRFVLWPETRDAIAAYLKKRPKPAGSHNGNLAFLTRTGLPWVRRESRVNYDSLAQAFTKTRTAAGVERGSFYDLRRTFRTVADATRDTPAVRLVMGHTANANDMDATYRQHIEDDRIRAVCEYVHEWLFKDARKAKSSRVMGVRAGQ